MFRAGSAARFSFSARSDSIGKEVAEIAKNRRVLASSSIQ
jgi:hypothetical protein